MTPTAQDLAPTRGVIYGLAFSLPAWIVVAVVLVVVL